MFTQLARAPKTPHVVKPSLPSFRQRASVAPTATAKQTGRVSNGAESNGRAPLAFDLARIRLGGDTAVPGRPTVSSPGDACEREADRVTQQMMRPGAHVGGFQPSGTFQAGAEPMARSTNSLDPATALKTTRSGGSPMPGSLRSFFEPRLGHDLSDVRVHRGEEAARGARAIGARAFASGPNIVFGQGQYAPDTAAGRRLLGHELVHVVQQRRSGGRGNVLMRTPLDQLPDAEKQSLKLDTDIIGTSTDLRQFFGLKGTPNLATNVTDSYEFETPKIDAVTDAAVKADLKQGLRLFALSRFDLLPNDKGIASSRRLRQVHLESLNLTRFGGPDASFRFTSLGSTDKKGAVTIRILIEEVAPLAKPMANPSETAEIERRKVVPYGLKRGASVSDPVWQKILRSLGTIDEALVMRVRDVTFETSSKQAGPTGEPAAFDVSFKTGPWTKTITLFQNMISASDVEFATLVAHELGHAIDAAPAEKPGGKIAKGEAHNIPAFKEAAKKDGGRAKSITQYGTTDDSEFYAENLSIFVQQPETLRALRPNIYYYFVQYEWDAVRDPKVSAPSLMWSTSRPKAP